MTNKEERENDSYLWDRSGPPDPEIDELESKLERFRYRPETDSTLEQAAFAHVQDCVPVEPPRWAQFPYSLRIASVAAAAVILFSIFWNWSPDSRPKEATAGYLVRGIAGLERVRPGESFVVGQDAPAVVKVGDIGDVKLQPGSRVKVVDCGKKVHQLDLELGTLTASIFAAPRVFQIGTPAGLTVDLGCEYNLSVDEHGTARLAVITGQVSFETAGRKVIVPRDAHCEAKKGDVPNTPVMDDADPEFVRAVREIEFAAEPDERLVELVLSGANIEDSLSLWHLLDATSHRLREQVYEKLARTYPQPSGVTREGILAGEVGMREAWRKQKIERDWK